MAKNTGNGYRKGAVTDRTQVHNPRTDTWTKRNSDDGRFMDGKKDGEPFKGVRREKQGRIERSSPSMVLGWLRRCSRGLLAAPFRL